MVRLVIGQTADGSTPIAPLRMTSSRRFGAVPAARQGVKYEVPVRNGAHSDSNFRVMAPSIASSITTHFYAQQSDSEMNLSKRKFMAQSLGCAGSGCKSLAQQCKFLKAYRVGCCKKFGGRNLYQISKAIPVRFVITKSLFEIIDLQPAVLVSCITNLPSTL